MNIDELTYREMKAIAALFTGSSAGSSTLYNNYIGKYVIVRSRNEGINAGVVKAADETGIILTDARRIYYHAPKDKKLSWYEGVAISGLSEASKISAPTEKLIREDYSITVCTDIAEQSIRGKESHEQS